MIAAEAARTAVRYATGPGVAAEHRGPTARQLWGALRRATDAGTGGAVRQVLQTTRLLADGADPEPDPVSMASAVAVLAGADDGRINRWPWAVSAGAAVAVLNARHADVRRTGTIMAGVLLGAELSCRLWTMLGPGHAAFWTAAGSVGGIGAALTSCVLLGEDEGQTADAIAIASSTTSGHRAHEGTDLGAFQAGCAAGNGVLAAYLAAAGVTGSPTAVEGPRGLLHAYGGDGAADGLLDDFGTRWTVLDAGTSDGQSAPDGAEDAGLLTGSGWMTEVLQRLSAKVAGCMTS